jgi:hypothetical protein
MQPAVRLGAILGDCRPKSATKNSIESRKCSLNLFWLPNALVTYFRLVSLAGSRIFDLRLKPSSIQWNMKVR